MRPHERTEITIETEWTVVIRRGHATRVWCRECGSDVEMIAIEQATAFTSTTRNWHCSKAQDGSLRVCLQSL